MIRKSPDPESCIRPEAAEVLSGSFLAASRLIRRIEAGDPAVLADLADLFPFTGNACVMGITGPPGAGKSTLISGLIRRFRDLGLRVGVLAIDPSSPVSGGAILGDRIRMQSHAADPGVFIRSMASRGGAGGLSRVARDVLVVLDALGLDMILLEPVGSGQSDTEIASLVHLLGVLVPPGTGDGVQTIKAGILETADIFIVNKCDLPGVPEAVADLRGMLHLRSRPGWVCETCARTGEGTGELADYILSRRTEIQSWQNRAPAIRDHFRSLVSRLALAHLEKQVADRIEAFLAVPENDRAASDNPYRLARELVEQLVRP
jgi:LAO/AO transport system kinase